MHQDFSQPEEPVTETTEEDTVMLDDGLSTLGPEMGRGTCRKKVHMSGFTQLRREPVTGASVAVFFLRWNVVPFHNSFLLCLYISTL